MSMGPGMLAGYWAINNNNMFMTESTIVSVMVSIQLYQNHCTPVLLLHWYERRNRYGVL